MEEKYKYKYCEKEYYSSRSLAAHCSHCKNITLYGRDIPKGRARKVKKEHIQKCKYCGKDFPVLCTNNIKLIVLKKKEIFQIINNDFISLESFSIFE